MPKIYVHYAITPKGELAISSYHERTQSFSNGFALIKKELKLSDLQKLEADIPDPYTNDDIKSKLLELLSTIKQSKNYNDVTLGKVTYKGDLNLCTGNKAPTPCLFDGTLNRVFPGKEVQLILESANREYVEAGIRLADSMGLVGAILQTKTSATEEALSKTYPQSGTQVQVNNNSIEMPTPKPDADALAQAEVKIKDPQTLSNALIKIGVFNTAKDSLNAKNPTTEDQKISTPPTIDKI
ncbi:MULTISPECIES: hypothetical protein [Legionella]|uniref:Uncharacterized protein n=1 Tax=Legionella resiliens TaxID=2905958 RepID=A0ABS8WZV7_9GAMM|nr:MULTISPECIES: hypothetical protein [unclassified Legionella]MCE0722877.1 hypothetical protein [Legionella sp. 9fVS26]MCE3532030.1 hypothetical protein [Legionella sp. 8cVS16]QLZ68149.1 hypothetical protein FOLKNPGA_00927 [Legionella sp. PC1000]